PAVKHGGHSGYLFIIGLLGLGDDQVVSGVVGHFFDTGDHGGHEVAVEARYHHADGIGALSPEVAGKCVMAIPHIAGGLLDPFARLLAQAGMIFQPPADGGRRKVQGPCDVVYGNFLSAHFNRVQRKIANWRTVSVGLRGFYAIGCKNRINLPKLRLWNFKPTPNLMIISFVRALVLIVAATVVCQGQVYLDPAQPLDTRVNDLIGQLTLEEKVQQMMNATPAIPRLNIPPYDWWNESLHGVARSGVATVFPQAIGLGATFDEDLIFRISSAISDEARAMYNAAMAKDYHKRYGGLTFWTPNINIFRDPRWGRGQETYGEDPYLTGLLG